MITEKTRQQPSGFSTFVWALFFFFIFTLLAVVWVRWTGMSRGYNVQRGEVLTKAKDARNRDDREKLLMAAWVDQAAGVVRLPIADAKRLVVAELLAKKPAPSQINVEPPLPMPVNDPKSTEPAPPALPSAPQGSDTLSFGVFAPPPPPAPVTPPAASPPAPGAPAPGEAIPGTPAAKPNAPASVPAAPPAVPAPIPPGASPPPGAPSVQPPPGASPSPDRPPLINDVEALKSPNK